MITKGEVLAFLGFLMISFRMQDKQSSTDSLVSLSLRQLASISQWIAGKSE